MAKKESKSKSVFLVNPNNFPVTVEYDGKSIVISPKQKVKVSDESKVGKSTGKLIKVNA